MQTSMIGIIITTTFLLLIAIALFILQINNLKNEKRYGLRICYILLFFSTFLLPLVLFFEKSSILSGLLINIYACAIFAIIYSQNIEQRTLHTIKTLHGLQISHIKYISDQIKLQARQNLFMPIKFYEPNKADNPNIDFFVQLTNNIINTKEYYYEGDNAVNASMCLLAASEELNSAITVHMLLRVYEIKKFKNITQEDRKNVKDLFATLVVLDKLNTTGKFKFILYKRFSKSSHYANLTDEHLLFSPFGTNEMGGGYPLTYLYSHEDKHESFYTQFRKSIKERMEDKNTQQCNNGDYFKFFDIEKYASNGYFGDSLINGNKKKNLDSSKIQEYFQPIIEERKRRYHEHFGRIKKQASNE